MGGAADEEDPERDGPELEPVRQVDGGGLQQSGQRQAQEGRHQQDRDPQHLQTGPHHRGDQRPIKC